jgi:hypothetical protein
MDLQGAKDADNRKKMFFRRNKPSHLVQKKALASLKGQKQTGFGAKQTQNKAQNGAKKPLFAGTESEVCKRKRLRASQGARRVSNLKSPGIRNPPQRNSAGETTGGSSAYALT